MQFDSYNRINIVKAADDKLVGQYWYDDQAGFLTSMSFSEANTDVGLQPGQEGPLRLPLPTSCGSGSRVRRMSRREDDGILKQFEIIYPSKYLSTEVQRYPDGEEIADTYNVSNNIFLNGVRIAAMVPSGDALYYLTDQVDSVKVVVDDEANAVSRMEYLPYGETWFQEGDTGHAPKYNSQELDRETGFYFYNARHYDPVVSRFVTADSVVDGEWDTQGWNRYSYTKGNPIVYRDPSGHFSLGDILTAVADYFTPTSANEEAEALRGSRTAAYAVNEGNQLHPPLGEGPVYDSVKSDIEARLQSNNVDPGQRAILEKVDKKLDIFVKNACVVSTFYGQMKDLYRENNAKLNTTRNFNQQLESNIGDFIVRGLMEEKISTSGLLTEKGKSAILSDYKVNGRDIGIRRISANQGAYDKLINNEIPAGVVGVRINNHHNQLLYMENDEWLRADPGRRQPTQKKIPMGSNYTADPNDNNRVTRENINYVEYLYLK